jgi:hypothetical protein
MLLKKKQTHRNNVFIKTTIMGCGKLTQFILITMRHYRFFEDSHTKTLKLTKYHYLHTFKKPSPNSQHDSI